MSDSRFTGVRPEKIADYQARAATAGLKEEDLIEQFVRGSGAGGQKINKTANAVYLKHVPTGTEVKCQKSRQRALNRFLARRALLEKLENGTQGASSKKEKDLARKRKQKDRRRRRNSS